MEDKTNNKIENPINMKVHINFKELLKGIQNERIKMGIDTLDKHSSMPKITKAFCNLIEANPKIKDMIIKVVIKNNGK